MPIQEGPVFPTVQWQKSGKRLKVFSLFCWKPWKRNSLDSVLPLRSPLPSYLFAKVKALFLTGRKKPPPKHTVHCSNTAGLKYALKVKLTCLELLMNISIMATLRFEILETAKKLSTGHTTSQPNHSKFSVWINCEDVSPMKNKGRVYTHISAGNKWWRFSVALDKGDLHTVLLPQMQQKTSQPYSLRLQLLPQCSCQPTSSSCFSILHSICAWPSDSVCRNCCCCFGGLAWTILTRSITAALKRKLYSSPKGAQALPKAQPTFHLCIRMGSCYLGSSGTLSRSGLWAHLLFIHYTAPEWKQRLDVTRQSSGLLNFAKTSPLPTLHFPGGFFFCCFS